MRYWMMLKRGLSLGTSALLAAGILTSCGPKDPAESGAFLDEWHAKSTAITAADLADTGDKQNRYLTIPQSRVVLNPFNFESQPRETSQVQYSNRPSMPLNVGYCDPYISEARGVEIPNAAMLAEKNAAGSAGMSTVWEGNTQDRTGWEYSGVEGKDYHLAFKDGRVEFSVAQDAEVAWQDMHSETTLDIDNTYLTVTIDSISPGGRVAVKVNKGSGVDTTLIETNTPGTYTYDLKQMTNWSGQVKLQVKIFAVERGATISCSKIKIEKGEKLYADASSYETEWRPDYLGFKAAYPKGTQVTGQDFFYDEKTLVRFMKVEGGSAFLVYGEYNGNARVKDGTVLIKRDTFQYAVSMGGLKPVFFASVTEALSGAAGSDEAPAGYGVWAYAVEEMPADGILRLAMAFDSKTAAENDVMALAEKPGADCDEKLAARTEGWNQWLSKVPRPENFDLKLIDAKGVTAQDVKFSYYEAWVQIIGNVLPAAPENDYPYASFATGKASLWAYGHKQCPYSATWESIYGMQYYAQIDAGCAWEMYRGLMSLVDEKGQIGGESLPSNNARVAWILYTVKPDKEALAEIQPNLTRHLKWRFENPRWIFGNNTPDTFQKDMDFVASALIDARYLMRINEELGLGEENADWETRNKTMYSNMKVWFFSKSREYPVQYYSAASGVRSDGNGLWVIKGLHIPDIQQSEIDDLMRLFNHMYNPDKPFAGMVSTKYEPNQYLINGLLEHGETEKACILAESALRDIVLTGIKAEGYYYQASDTKPLPDGVRPSMFGCALTIDNVWLLNGVRFDDGMPVFINCFDRDGGVENYTVGEKAFHFSKAGTIYTTGGSAIGTKTVEVAKGEMGFPFPDTKVHPLQ